MAYTEFYCNASTGSNENAGDNKTLSQTTNGAYTQGGGAGGTDLFTATGGTPFSSASVGDFIAVCDDAETVADFVGRITAINLGGLSVDISLTAIAGTRPGTAATGKTGTIGGVWKGPNAAVAFPFGFITAALTNTSGDPVRVNFKNGTSYTISAAMTHSLVGSVRFEGYTTTVGDGGIATIDANANAIIVLTVSGNNIAIVNFWFTNNGNSGANAGLVVSGSKCYIRGCIANSIRGTGIDITGANIAIVECEAYNCNKNNSTSIGGFRATSSAVSSSFIRCISHHNTGNSDGFVDGVSATYDRCISDSNAKNGWNFTTTATNKAILKNCDIHRNSGHGALITWTGLMMVMFESCNFISNSGFGIVATGGGGGSNLNLVGELLNCRFGSGAYANGSGIYSGINALSIIDSFPYDAGATPWSNFANGNFTVNYTGAQSSGRGFFASAVAGYSGTIGYPSIGAANSSGSVGSSSTTTITSASTPSQRNLPDIRTW